MNDRARRAALDAAFAAGIFDQADQRRLNARVERDHGRLFDACAPTCGLRLIEIMARNGVRQDVMRAVLDEGIAIIVGGRVRGSRGNRLGD